MSILFIMSIVVYFYVLRKMVARGLMFDFQKVLHVVFLLLVGLIPVINIIFILIIVIDYNIWRMNLTTDDILKKALFLDVEKDRRDI